MKSTSLHNKIDSLPQNLKNEINDFVDFLIEKRKKRVKVKKKRKAGFLKGKIEISPDFDAPLDDFKEYM